MTTIHTLALIRKVTLTRIKMCTIINILITLIMVRMLVLTLIVVRLSTYIEFMRNINIGMKME